MVRQHVLREEGEQEVFRLPARLRGQQRVPQLRRRRLQQLLPEQRRHHREQLRVPMDMTASCMVEAHVGFTLLPVCQVAAQQTPLRRIIVSASAPRQSRCGSSRAELTAHDITAVQSQVQRHFHLNTADTLSCLTTETGGCRTCALTYSASASSFIRGLEAKAFKRSVILRRSSGGMVPRLTGVASVPKRLS